MIMVPKKEIAKRYPGSRFKLNESQTANKIYAPLRMKTNFLSLKDVNFVLLQEGCPSIRCFNGWVVRKS